MSLREFLSGFQSGRRLVDGAFYTQDPTPVQTGETVGVVLMGLGGPSGRAEVEAFLYSRMMDPAEVDVSVPRPIRQRAARLWARRRSRTVVHAFEQIGGTSPLKRHTNEQARALERRLNARFGALSGVQFRVYVAMRHGEPTSAEAARQMALDGVTRVVLLPLSPHYAASTTGSWLASWKALEAAGEVPTWPTSSVHEYAAHPKLVQALSERIDEGLQRFPRDQRHKVQVVFAAQGAPKRDLTKHRDPFCCLVHATVQQIVDYRAEPSRNYHVCFGTPFGPRRGLAPAAPDCLAALADEGHSSVLVLPISFLSDRVETVHGIDIELRREAHALGIDHFEVTSGLNCHPLLVEALAEVVASQVRPTALSQGDGVAAAFPIPLVDLPRHAASARVVRCGVCPLVTEPRDWSGVVAAQVPAPDCPTVSPATRPTP